jgi:crotonobetainyl-CoA:carnitine CoA-transferase CaiB-like acyl-CoA transferase
VILPLGPLAGIIATDLSNSVSGAWCSRLLADYGADVTMIEEPSGHVVRSFNPRTTEGTGVLEEWFLANKRSMLCDPTDEYSQSQALNHVKKSDIVILPEQDSRFAEMLSGSHSSRQVRVCISPHGLVGDLSSVPGNDLTSAARSGWASINGTLGQSPLKPSGWQASYGAGTFATLGVISALRNRKLTGEGVLLDISELDAAVSALSPGFLQSQYSGDPVHQSLANDLSGGPVPIADGYFALTLSRAHFWRDAMTLLGLTDLAEDPKWESQLNRRERKAEYMDRVIQAMSSWRKYDLFNELALRRVVAGPVLNMQELVENEHLRGRNFWQQVGSLDAGRIFPGPAAKMSATPITTRKLAPRIGENTAEFVPGSRVFENSVESRAINSHETDQVPSSEGPLAGLTGVVLTQAWAGTYCTMLLAMLGADVIQVEVRRRPDGWRGGYEGKIPVMLRDRETAVHPWNCGPLYNSVNLGKRCVTLDLSDLEGLAAFRKLVSEADFVAENFSPRVMNNFGVGYDSLKEIKPDIILCSLSAYGHTGPWENVPGIGGTIEPSSGMSSLLGYDDGVPLNSGQMYPDAVAGLNAATAITAALYHKEITGEGQFIDLSMMEANITFVGEALSETLWTSEIPGPLGNKHRTWAPHDIYQSQNENDSREAFIAISCETESEWKRLSELILAHTGAIDLSKFETLEGRKVHELELDLIMTKFCRTSEINKLVRDLQSNQIPAALVRNTLEVSFDSHLISRGLLQSIDHPEAGHANQATLPIQFDGRKVTAISAAPCHGEHSWEILRDFVGMSEETFGRLVEMGITGEGPPPGA